MAYRSNSNNSGNEDDRSRRNEDQQGRWQDFERERGQGNRGYESSRFGGNQDYDRGGFSSNRPNEGRFSGNQDYQTGGFGNRGYEGQNQQGQGRSDQNYDRGGYEGRGAYGSGGSGTYGSGGVTLAGNYNTGGGTGDQEHQKWSPGRGFYGNPSSQIPYGNQGGYGNQGQGGNQSYDQGYGRQAYGNQGSYGNQGYGQGRPSTRNEAWQGRGTGRNEEYRFGSGEGSSGFGQQTGTGSANSAWRGREPWDQGPHSGRGPQGYQRSSESIKEEACERLTRHGHVDATSIRIQVESGEITLEGTVKTRREKRLAEEALESLSGVRDVHNRLRVEGGFLSSLFGDGSSSADQESGSQSTGSMSPSSQATSPSTGTQTLGSQPASTQTATSGTANLGTQDDTSTGSATLGDQTGESRSRGRK